jgi:hypothetical protein
VGVHNQEKISGIEIIERARILVNKLRYKTSSNDLTIPDEPFYALAMHLTLFAK